MPVSFTDLPSELILACLEYLPYTELGACLLANRHLNSLIRNSPRTLYLAEQSLAGVDANPFHPAISGLCVEEKRALLHEREDRWLFFRPVSLEYPEIDFLASRAVYWISGDYWVIGDAVDPAFPRSVGLKFLRTTPGPSQWTKASPGTMLRLVDFVAVPEELDLIAMITHSPSGQSTSSIHIHLLSFSSLSTGSAGPHPLAASSVIHVLDAGPYDGGPSVTIDISGRTLAFCMLYLSARDEDNEEGREHARRRDGLYLYDWQTGKRMTEEPLPVHHNGAVGLTFLSPDLLLLSNTSTNSLDILSIPTLTITHTLALPELQARHQLCPFQFRTLPNPAWADPRTRFSRSYTRFLPDPERTLVQCAFQTMSPVYEYTLGCSGSRARVRLPLRVRGRLGFILQPV
ncbi:F-box domain-containing protein [Mycena chlorophos]|uniref:F-box domain-containing protein n=1 Tax=Mycena chlorophos TaxID=658473 RepID=A0A8H6WCY4_MYCCL|nr:F-box domain-containing protein [Mycena chlorophos]